MLVIPQQDHSESPVTALLELALTLPETERASFVQKAASDNSKLISEVLEELEWEKRMAGFLQTPVLSRVDVQDSLEPGTLLAGRFTIVRLIAEGGMALVYESLDQMSSQRVALKIPKLPFRRRLLAELHSALEVTHPNLCRVHAIHRAEMPSGASFEFLTMEYLEGETLAQRLTTSPAISLEEAAEITRQICAGLEEAHKRDVTHGDLKPSNIIIAKDKKGRLRAVITDFGLARVSLGSIAEAAPSLRGTPDFIAPELWRGGTPSKASDIYALGVILFAMLTGTRPLQSLALSERLDSVPLAPHKLVPQVPVVWSSKVLACLSPTASKRPSSAGEIAAVFAKPAQPRRLRLALALVAALFGLTTWGFFKLSPALPPSDLPLRLAILPPAADDQTAMLAIGMAEDWSAQLSITRKSRHLSIIPVALAYRYHVKSPEQAYATLGASHTLRISTRIQSGKINFSGTINAAGIQSPVKTWGQILTLDSLGEVVEPMQTHLQSALGLSLVSPVTLLPPAYAEQVEGIYYLSQVSNHQLALAHFLQAKQIDARSAAPLLRLAETEILRFRNSSDPEALRQSQHWLDRARRLQGTTPSASYWLLEATLATERGQSSDAGIALRQALDAEPENLKALTALARHLAGTSRSNEAIELLRQGTHLAPGYFQPLLELGVALYFAGRYDEAEAEYKKVIAIAPDLSQARQNLAAVYADTGRYLLAEQQLQQALRLDRTPDTLAGMGALLAYQGKHVESAQNYEQAVSISPEDFLLLSNLGDSYRRTGKSAEAMRIYNRALNAGKARLTQTAADAYTRSFVAYLCARLGHAVQAKAELRSALALAPNDAKVCRRAILTYEVLGMQDAAFAALASAPPTVLRELARHPDLSLFRQDARFTRLGAPLGRPSKKG